MLAVGRWISDSEMIRVAMVNIHLNVMTYLLMEKMMYIIGVGTFDGYLILSVMLFFILFSATIS